MKFKSATAIALVSAALIAAPLAPASANDGRHALFGLGAAVGVLAFILTAPFNAVAGPGPRAYDAPRAAYYPPPTAYYPPPPAYYPPPMAYYPPPPGYAYAPPPGYSAYPPR